MREVKEPEIRKAEIMDAAKKMFHQKGYVQTTTQDIIDQVGISRGLLYYHFESKEEILFAIVEKHIRPLAAAFQAIASDPALSAGEKVRAFLDRTMIRESTASEEDHTLHEAIHLPENTYMMDRINHKLSRVMAEHFGRIIQQGNREGVFRVEHPEETAEFLMTGYTFVVNSGSVDTEKIEGAMKLLEAYKRILGAALGCETLFDR